MHKFYVNYGALMAAKWLADKKKEQAKHNNQLLKSRRIEDEIYKNYRKTCGELQHIEDTYSDKLPVIENLSKDVFQGLYTLNVQHNPSESLTPLVRQFNQHILSEIMKSPEYPALKSMCEGREYMSGETAMQFMDYVGDNFDTLMQIANGKNNALNALESVDNHRQKLLDRLKQQCEQYELSQDCELEKDILKNANRLHSKEEQVEYLGQQIKDNLATSDTANRVAQTAIFKAKEMAMQTANILSSWGDSAGDGEPSELDRELLQKVQQSPKLLDIAKYLGKLKEFIKEKRKNSFAFGRGEKYSLELGGDISKTLSSELALLATTATTPLFLRKLQQKTLKQYARRERICKGQGDIIVCLDESASTEGDNAAYGKAVAFAMLEIARLHSRDFALIHFASESECKTDLFEHGNYTQEDILQSAQHFFNGGTDFERPLTEAIDLIANRNWQNADILFITDGECSVSEEFAKRFTAAKMQYGFTVTAILLDMDDNYGFSLIDFCDEIVRVSEVTGESTAENLLSDRCRYSNDI